MLLKFYVYLAEKVEDMIVISLKIQLKVNWSMLHTEIFFKMQSEKIFLFSIKAMVCMTAFLIFYLVWKYLNNKPLGMQTILDHMTKDYIKICIVNIIMSWLTSFKFIPSYEHHIAITILMCNYFSILAWFWQIFVTVIIRYITIFYSPILNNIDDIKVKMTTRCFVGFVSLSSTFMRNFQGHFAHVANYAFLTNKYGVKIDSMNPYGALQFVVVADLIALIVVQIKIEIFERNLENHNQIDKMENGFDENFKYSKGTIRFVLVFTFLFFLFVIHWLLWEMDETKEDIIALSELRLRLVSQCIFMNLIPLVLIKRNPKMYQFCVKKINIWK